MSDRDASNGVLFEMVRSLKEDIIPREFQQVHIRLDKINGRVDRQEDKLSEMERREAERKGEIGVWKWIITLIGGSTIVQWVANLLRSS